MILDSLHTMSIIDSMAMELSTPTSCARPLVKWAGGKQALAPELVARFPSKMGRYFEPFVGGASVFLELHPKRAVISDGNRWLIDTYTAVRDSAGEVARLLETMPNTKEHFLKIRGTSPDKLSLPKRAAHFIYLNKTCFRGLYRVNRAGRFNVPYGAYDRRYFDDDNLRAFANRLAEVDLRCGDFEYGLAGAEAGDFCYFDPPYYKLGGFSDFNRYTPLQFREKDHFRLAAVCRELDARGVVWAMSNSDTPLIRGLYRGFSLTVLSARREINLKSAKRDITELFISNY